MSGTVSILIVDDNEADQATARRKINQFQLSDSVYSASNGAQALALLRGTESVAAIPEPRVVLLDWHMPVMSGKEFLEEISKDAALHDLVIFVMTAMPSPEDRDYALQHHVADYVSKENIREFFVTYAQVFKRVAANSS